MKIEAGKYYKTRDGRKVGPAALTGAAQPWHKWKVGEFTYYDTGVWSDGYDGDYRDLIAEWTDPPNVPKLWKDMTHQEKGALLLAHHEGKVIERSHNQGTTWKEKANDLWHENHAYRVKPTVETVTINGRNTSIGWEWISANPSYHTHRITFQTIDGKPDPSSIRMEELK